MKSKTVYSFIVQFLLICGLTHLSIANWSALPLGYEDAVSIGADSTGSRLWIVERGWSQRAGYLYVDGSFWGSRDGGQHWTAADNAQWSRMDYGSYIHFYPPMDPAGDTLLVRTIVDFNSLYWTSYNSGQSWNQLIVDGRSHIMVSPVQRNLWLMPWGYSTFRQTTNAGVTWDTLSGSLPFPGNFAFDAVRDSTLYVFDATISDTNRGVWQSANYGLTWQRIFNPAILFENAPIRIANFQTLSYGTLLATVIVNGTTRLFFSDNNGQGWEEMSSIPPDFGWTLNSSVIEDVSCNGNLYLFGSTQGGVLRSADYGRSWYSCLGGLPAQLDSALTMYVQPFSGHLYLSLKDHGLYRSVDHGANWQHLTMPHTNCCATEFSFFETGIALCENSFADTTWLRTNDDSAWHSLPITRPDTQARYTYISPLLSMTEDTLIRLECAVNYNSLNPAKMFRSVSTDQGQTWQSQRISNPVRSNSPIFMRTLRNDPLLLLVCFESQSYDSSFWLTDDRGNSWQIFRMPSVYSPVSSEYIQGDTATYLCDVRTGIWVTSNHGEYWRQLLPNGGSFLLTMTVLNGTKLYSGYKDKLMLWNGTQWDTVSVLPGNSQDSYSHLLGVPDQNILFLSNTTYSPNYENRFYSSSDGGVIWNSLNIALPDVLPNREIGRPQYDPYRHRIWLTTINGPCYIETSELTGASSDRPLHFKPADFTVLSAYPNPFNGSTRIRYDLDRQAKVQLQIFDLQGRLVTTLLDDISEPGSHELHWKADNLSSGTYFVRLQTPAGVHSEKLLLLK